MPWEGAVTSGTGTNVSCQIVTGKGRMYGFVLLVSTSAGNATLYDNTDASGRVLGKLLLSNTAVTAQSIILDKGVSYNTGIYLAVSGSGMTSIVYYV